VNQWLVNFVCRCEACELRVKFWNCSSLSHTRIHWSEHGSSVYFPFFRSPVLSKSPPLDLAGATTLPGDLSTPATLAPPTITVEGRVLHRARRAPTISLARVEPIGRQLVRRFVHVDLIGNPTVDSSPSEGGATRPGRRAPTT
jgi:hypothetical protein